MPNPPARGALPVEHRPFPDLADALRSQGSAILTTWMQRVRQTLPWTTEVPDDDLKDNIPRILASMANVMELATQGAVLQLMTESPAQGLARFHQHYEVADLLTEDRILRTVIIEHVEAALKRRMTQDEQVTLDMAVDVMLQHAVAAFVDLQKSQLRAATETELKYLSFLSHDLTSNLGALTMLLEALKLRLGNRSEFSNDVVSLNAAQQAIVNTTTGMRRLLDSERLRKAGVQPQRQMIQLAALAAGVARQFAAEAQRKGITLVTEVPDDAVVHSDGELINLVLQNLVGNAIKYASGGTVRITAGHASPAWKISVTDEGPGIAAEHLARIFEAFRRGEAHGQDGVGLGLAIASQAARLLGAELTVESKPGQGSTFTMIL